MKKKRILVVDDEPHILELIKVSLEHEDFEILQARDGEEALKYANEEPPDLILLDISMPKMDGYEVCKTLKSVEKTRRIPVLFLTSKNYSIDEEKGKQAGAEVYLTKPFSPLKLLAIVKESMGK